LVLPKCLLTLGYVEGDAACSVYNATTGAASAAPVVI
jgi:hypothetical protein